MNTGFWGFIDEERNNILKEFEVNAGQGVSVRPGSRPNVYHYPFRGLPEFEGKTQPEMIRLAIAWWETQLSQIDAAAELSP